MGIENIKRWHWCIIGIVVGCIIASISLWAGPKEDPHAITVMFSDFESQVLRGQMPRRGYGVIDIRDFKVHPAIEFINPETRATEITDAITYKFKVLEKPVKDKPGHFEATPLTGRLLIVQPGAIAKDGKPGSRKYVSVVGSIEGLTTRQYVEKVQEYVSKLDKAKYPSATQIKLKTAWIEEPKWAYTAYGVGGFVVIGLIWPTVLNLLIGAGLGRAPKEPEYDLSRYKGDSKSAEKPKAVVTDEDMDKLKALEEELEESLREGAVARQPVAAVATAEPQIKKLEGGPLESAKEESKPAVNKAFGADQGDYYPTEVHGKPK